jgi:hypothetical protein
LEINLFRDRFEEEDVSREIKGVGMEDMEVKKP